MKGKESGREFFEAAYQLGDKRVEAGLGWPIKGVGEHMNKFLSVIKKYMTSGRVLDIGCGEGRISIFFANNGFESYGIDYTKIAVERAKKFAKEADVSENTHFNVCNALDLPYKENFFDIAVDYSVFDHIEKQYWGLYLKNLLKVLKPKGFYILSVFSANTDFIKNRKQKWYYSGDAYFHFCLEKDIRDIFEKNFKILEIIERLEAKYPPPFMFYHILMRKK